MAKGDLNDLKREYGNLAAQAGELNFNIEVAKQRAQALYSQMNTLVGKINTIEEASKASATNPSPVSIVTTPEATDAIVQTQSGSGN